MSGERGGSGCGGALSYAVFDYPVRPTLARPTRNRRFDYPPTREGKRLMRGLVVFGVILAILLVVFALQNNATVTVTFLLWRFESSLALVLLLYIF